MKKYINFYEDLLKNLRKKTKEKCFSELVLVSYLFHSTLVSYCFYWEYVIVISAQKILFNNKNVCSCYREVYIL